MLRRVVIEAVTPQVDDGRFPIKRTPGEDVVVEADVFADGHDAVAAVVLWRACGARTWSEAPMRLVENDRWAGAFQIERDVDYEYSIEAWIDRFESWRQELSKKIAADQDVASELLEGAGMVGAAAERAARRDRAALRKAAAALGRRDAAPAERLATAMSADLHAAMGRAADRSHATRHEPPLRVNVERERARYGAWYEMFPRSATPDPARSATFAEAESMLPYVASMGFDVVYLPPIHPIGRSFRKGRNNALTPETDAPGSPWAIGSAEGGHTSVEPGLGSIGDFEHFVETAGRHGLEVALDIAFQASPDHPYVIEHPSWFRHRPDGTIKYAENPPKKYQDIYPFDFESDDWPALWTALKDVVAFWIDRGVRIFRVDNPHTKPFHFWQWALGDLRRAHRDAVFLAEAFTRPKIMRYLAKAGFSQSYSYFTWRNTKAELTDYFTELASTPVVEYMRPNLFANTPDILHEYLQRGGRAAFEARLVLAATLGASYGIYSGFELGEHAPLRPGSEEYLDSEKYEIKPRDYSRADSLAELIARVNAIRRGHRALQFDRGLAFHETDNEQLLCYSKRAPDGADLIVVVVNLDPSNLQHGWIRLPPEFLNRTVIAHDLLTDETYYWRGERNYVRLDPLTRVAHILELQ
ncbi:MAG: alpha-1,4-glucan--maltose-1-phosphate maltosyltransferase [Vicinamibacterales bacterium]